MRGFLGLVLIDRYQRIDGIEAVEEEMRVDLALEPFEFCLYMFVFQFLESGL